MAAGGTITFTVSIEQSAGDLQESTKLASITVSDSGPGFSDVQLSKVFKEGFTTKLQGHGYGLLAVKEAIDKNEGDIEVKNRPNGGAQFLIRFPLAGG
jgi:sensor histidine kinase regulating citrate/malate metabolism